MQECLRPDYMNTNFFLNCVAGNVFGTKTTPAIPATYYIGLSTTEPNINGSNVTEPSSEHGYARVPLSAMSEPVNGVVSNTSPIDFNESTASWGVITHYVIYDSETVGSGNLLMYGELSAPRTVEASTVMTIRNDSLKLSVVNPT